MHNSVIFKASKDFISSKFLFLSFAPFLISILILASLFIYGGSEFIALLDEGAKSGDYAYMDDSGYPILSYLLGFAVFHWLLMALFFMFGTIGVVLLSLIIAVVVVGFLTPYIVSIVRKNGYENIDKTNDDTFLISIFMIFKIFLKFIFLLLCTLPFLLLPFINFLIIQLPFFYLFYKLLIYDIVSCGICKDAENIIRENRFYLFIVMGFFFLLSLIPMLGLLLQVFFIVYLSHFILSKSKSTSDIQTEVL